MLRTLTNCRIPISGLDIAKLKVLNLAKGFSIFCLLDNHQYQYAPHSYELILAAGCRRRILADAGNALDQLESFYHESGGWLFGHLSYDLKNEIEKLYSDHPDHTDFPDLFFFEPEVIFFLSENELRIEAEDPGSWLKKWENASSVLKGSEPVPLKIGQRFTQEEYKRTIEKLRGHILRGDCYEINFCQEFFAEKARIDPINVYQRLGAISPNPFSALYRLEDKWLICGSPERFLKKEGNHILSQPIKGTSPRVFADETSDLQSRSFLEHSEKDRAENVMVVDLVRNDLARVCKGGSVKADELFGVYAFPQVFQMISTVSGELKEKVSLAEILRATFPMGSMTGAPKKRVMELIEQYESTKRGIFSGALGYFKHGTHPLPDFDFSVVIRSIMYNETNQYLSFQAGSGITFNSDPEKEWQECLLKTRAMQDALQPGN